MILQAQNVYKILNIATPGTLSDSLTSTEAATVTDLTVTGTIDARDFRYMRDKMSYLANIDISGVNIVSYTNVAEGYNYPENEIPSYIFVTGVTSSWILGKYSLKTIKLPNTIKSIGEGAFYGCSNLTDTITIPKSVTTIKTNAFSGCNKLSTFKIEAGNSEYSALEGVIYNKDQTSLIVYPGGKQGECQIPNSITCIEAGAFNECYTLSGSLTIPNTVSSIGVLAFNNCSGFTGNLIIPNTVTSIGNSAFSGCNGFTGSLTIPNSVTEIGDFAFARCNGFTGRLTLPNSFTTVGKWFYEYYDSGCYRFSELFLPQNITNISSEAFGYFCSLEKIFSANPVPSTLNYEAFSYMVYFSAQLIVPPGSKTAYQNAPGWSNFTNITEQDFTTDLLPKEQTVCKIYGVKGLLTIESNTSNTLVEIFTLSGSLVKSIYTQGERTEISLPTGIYIVRAGKSSYKIAL